VRSFEFKKAKKQQRKCRICGCTEQRACLIENVFGELMGCSWVKWDLCNNAKCVVAASIARAERIKKARHA
jgi:hypothetical protein